MHAAGTLRVEPSATAGDIAAAARGNAHYIVDVETRSWTLGYFPTAWTRYRLQYVAIARIIDTATSTVVASGTCQRLPESSVGAPTWDELSLNNGAILKREMALSVQACVATLKKDMLAL